MTGMNFAPVRVGVVGLGRFGKLHSLTLAGLAEAELAGVVARREESLRELDAVRPGLSGWTDLDRATSECDAEARLVARPQRPLPAVPLHRAQILRTQGFSPILSLFLHRYVLGFPTGRDSATFRDSGTGKTFLSRDKGTTG